MTEFGVLSSSLPPIPFFFSFYGKIRMGIFRMRWPDFARCHFFSFFFFLSKTQISLSHGQFRVSSFQIRLWERLREMYIRFNGSVDINRLVHAQCLGIAISVNSMDTQRLNENIPCLFCMNILNTLVHKQRPHYAASVAGSSTGGITGNGKATKNPGCSHEHTLAAAGLTKYKF